MAYVGTKLKKEINIEEIITIHYFEYMNDFEFAGEFHDFWELLYVDKGKVLVLAEDREYLMTTGDIIFHKPNEFHAIRTEGSEAPNLVAVSFKCQSTAMDFFYNKKFKVSVAERVLLSYIITEASNAFLTPLYLPSVEQVEVRSDPLFGSEQLILNYLELFLITMKRKLTDKGLNSVESGGNNYGYSNNLNAFEQIIDFLQEHLCEQLRVEDICLKFSLSRSSLQAMFKKKRHWSHRLFQPHENGLCQRDHEEWNDEYDGDRPLSFF